jgi:hypothetical protein
MPPAQRFGHSESPISVIAASLSSKLEPSTSTQCPNDRLQTLFIFTCCIKIISPSLSLHSTHKSLYLYMWFFFSLFVWQENSKRWIEFYNRYIYIYIYKHQIVNKEIKYKRVTKCIWPLLLHQPNLLTSFSLSTPKYSAST